MNKVFKCEYYTHGSFGISDTYHVLAVEITKEAALGAVLMEYPETSADKWTIEEVDQSVRQVIEVCKTST